MCIIVIRLMRSLYIHIHINRMVFVDQLFTYTWSVYRCICWRIVEWSFLWSMQLLQNCRMPAERDIIYLNSNGKQKKKKKKRKNTESTLIKIVKVIILLDHGRIYIYHCLPVPLEKETQKWRNLCHGKRKKKHQKHIIGKETYQCEYKKHPTHYVRARRWFFFSWFFFLIRSFIQFSLLVSASCNFCKVLSWLCVVIACIWLLLFFEFQSFSETCE